MSDDETAAAAEPNRAEDGNAENGETDSAEGNEQSEAPSLAERAGEYDEELATAVESRLESLESELDEREERIADLESRLKRTQADFQNYKKRAEKRRQQVEERATEDLVERLLDVRDNLQRAVEEESGDAESLREGVEMTVSEFDRVLEDEDVSEIAPEPGTEVDPQRHEVMLQVESEQPEGTIEGVYTSGYEMSGEMLRSAQVTVSEGNEE